MNFTAALKGRVDMPFPKNPENACKPNIRTISKLERRKHGGKSLEFSLCFMYPRLGSRRACNPDTLTGRDKTKITKTPGKACTF